MTPQTQAAILSEWRTSLPAVLDGQDPMGERVWDYSMFKRPISRIVGAVADHTGISYGAILSSRRARYTVRARFIAYYVIRETTEFSMTEIGKPFKRDRTSVTYGLKHLDNDMLRDANNIIEGLR